MADGIRKIEIRIDFLNINITVSIVEKGQVVAQRMKLREEYPKLPVLAGDNTDTAGLHTSYYDHYWGVSWLFLEAGCPISDVNHEIQHVVDYISEYFGINHTEFRAYLFSYITEKIIGLKTI